MFDDYGTRPNYHVVERVLGKPEMAGRTAIFQIGTRPVLKDELGPLLTERW